MGEGVGAAGAAEEGCVAGLVVGVFGETEEGAEGGDCEGHCLVVSLVLLLRVMVLWW